MRIIKPKYIIPYMKLKFNIGSYIPYLPPHRGGSDILDDKSAEDNFDYFLKNKDKRCILLEKFVKKLEFVDMNFSINDVCVIERFSRRYGGLLFVANSYLVSDYRSQNQEWSGKNIGCSIMFDIGIYIGEIFIRNYNGFYWGIYKKNIRYNAIDNLELYNFVVLVDKNGDTFDICSLAFIYFSNLSRKMYLLEDVVPEPSQIVDYANLIRRVSGI